MVGDGCCAAAARGQATAPPPIALMKSRRRMASPRIPATPVYNTRYDSAGPERFCRRPASYKFRKELRHRPVDLAAERYHEVGDAVEPLPAPLIEFRRLPVARGQGIHLVILAGEAQREPFLPLAAEFRQPVRWRSVIRREIVGEPSGLAERPRAG